MATFRPLFSQWRSPDKIYLLKQSDPDTLLVRIYDRAHACLFKKKIEISSLELPENVEIAQNPQAVVEHLVAMQVIGDELALPKVAPIDIFGCHLILRRAIDTLRLLAVEDSTELEKFTCPITFEPFLEPVMDEHGHTFERSAIEEHLDKRDHAGCPINRQPINTLTPNLAIKQALDELRAQTPVPTFAQFKKQNDGLAQKNAEMARAYMTEGEYSEALDCYTKMVQYTQDSALYEEVVTLFDLMEDKNKATLSRLFLASYQLKEDKIEEACRTLRQAHIEMESVIEIMEALVELYLHKKDLDQAVALVQAQSDPDDAQLKRKLIALCEHILAHYPTAYPLYMRLANWSEDPSACERIIFQGICVAIQQKEDERVKDLFKIRLINQERSQYEELPLFPDWLLFISILETQETKKEIVDHLRKLALHFSVRKMPVQEVKVYKQIAYLELSSKIFRDIMRIYSTLDKKDKLSRWCSKWLSYLITQESWQEAEEVTLQTKKLLDDTLSINESLEELYVHYKGHRLKHLYLELGIEYSQRKQWANAERVYRLGYERCAWYEFAFGLAQALEHQGKDQEAVRQYYIASEAALLEEKNYYLSACIKRIKKLNPSMDFLPRNQRIQILTQGEIVRLSARVQELEHAAKPPSFFGAEKWRQYFGDVGVEPPLPENIQEILAARCPFWPDKCIKDTHLLTLIPATVDRKFFCLNLLLELIQHPKGGGRKTDYDHRAYKNMLKAQLGDQPPSSSYWVLMSRDVLEGTRGQFYDGKCEELDELRKGLPYKPPKVLEATTVVLMEYVQSGMRLFGREPMTYTCCQEEVDDSTVVIGGFGAAGLCFGTHFLIDKRDGSAIKDVGGLAALRKF